MTAPDKNGAVIMPQFEDPQPDARAPPGFRDAYAKPQVVPIELDTIASG